MPHGTVAHVDALIVGAGFAGIYSTYSLKKLGFNVTCLERGDTAGGVWHWNRYPGCMSDTESYIFRFSWDAEDLQNYPWPNRYVSQPEILKYLNHVVDRHHLRDHIQFNTEMESATWDDETGLWTVKCASGDTFVARYFLSAIGGLSEPKFPKIAGIGTFKGTLVHTQDWPADLDLTDKKVGVIGNGSTGVQLMTAVAPIVKRLCSFQRSPQYSVPSGQGPVTAEYRQRINKSYNRIYDDIWNSAGGYNIKEVKTPMSHFSAEERRRIFDTLWDGGNAFRFFFSGFGDIGTNEVANRETCKYIRSKIDEIVKDPEKARILKPTDLYNRRPLCDSGYYQIFNRDNVDLVYLRENPISTIEPEGIRLADGTLYDLDVIVVATGFDVFEGAYARTTITGRQGRQMSDHWRGGPSTYAGVAMAGFPNMFTVFGPQGPFANSPSVIEVEVNFITDLIKHAESQAQKSIVGRKSKSPVIEVNADAERAWRDRCDREAEGSLFKAPGSWIFGQNIVGREPSPNWLFSGLKGYLSMVREQAEDGYPAFNFHTAAQSSLGYLR